jgi:hypothetical protein
MKIPEQQGAETLPRRVERALWAAGLGLFIAGVSLLGSQGCQSAAGIFCQQQSECSTGLLCSKPPGASATSFGVCEPARKGFGELCTYSSECQAGLRCSTELAGASDQRHGTCQPGPSSPTDAGIGDAAAADLLPGG